MSHCGEKLRCLFILILFQVPCCYSRSPVELNFNNNSLIIHGGTVSTLTEEISVTHEPETDVTEFFLPDNQVITLELSYPEKINLYWDNFPIQTLLPRDLNTHWFFFNWPCSHPGKPETIKKLPSAHILFPNKQCREGFKDQPISLHIISIKTKTSESNSYAHPQYGENHLTSIIPMLYRSFLTTENWPILAGKATTDEIDFLYPELSYRHDITQTLPHDITVMIANIPISGNALIHQSGAGLLNDVVEQATSIEQLVQGLNSILPKYMKLSLRSFREKYLNETESVLVKNIMKTFRGYFGQYVESPIRKLMSYISGATGNSLASPDDEEKTAHTQSKEEEVVKRKRGRKSRGAEKPVEKEVPPPKPIKSRTTELLNALIETTETVDSLAEVIFIMQGRTGQQSDVIDEIIDSDGNISKEKLRKKLISIPNYLFSLKRYYNKIDTSHRLYQALKALGAYNEEEIDFREGKRPYRNHGKKKD